MVNELPMIHEIQKRTQKIKWKSVNVKETSCSSCPIKSVVVVETRSGPTLTMLTQTPTNEVRLTIIIP